MAGCGGESTRAVRGKGLGEGLAWAVRGDRPWEGLGLGRGADRPVGVGGVGSGHGWGLLRYLCRVCEALEEFSAGSGARVWCGRGRGWHGLWWRGVLVMPGGGEAECESWRNLILGEEWCVSKASC